MPINTKDFVNTIKSNLKGAGETVKNYADVVKSNVKLNGVIGIGGENNKLANKMMEKYPASTVIGYRKFEKRKGEVKNMIKKGQFKQARDFISNKKKEFKQLNKQ